MLIFFIYFWSPLKQEQFSSNSLIHDQIMWLSISTVVKWHLMMLNGKNKAKQKSKGPIACKHIFNLLYIFFNYMKNI